MFGQYYHRLIRKYVIGFGSMFSDVVVQRTDSSGTRVQTVAVPISYGPKEKFLVRMSQDPRLDQKVAITLPRMGFEITSMTYNGNRKVSSVQKASYGDPDDPDSRLVQYVPVPYDIGFDLHVFVHNNDDGAQIIEQVVPYFTPDWTLSLKLVPEMNIVMDVPYVLQNVSPQDVYEGDFDTRRAFIWTLSFLCRAWFFGPVSRSGVIKRVQVDFHANTHPLTARSSRVVVTPGLTANGDPTSNSSLSIPYEDISAEDDYGFVTEKSFYTDGKRYDPKTGDDV